MKRKAGSTLMFFSLLCTFLPIEGCTNKVVGNCPTGEPEYGPFVQNDCITPACVKAAGFSQVETLSSEFERQINDTTKISYLFDLPRDSAYDRLEARYYSLKTYRPFTKQAVEQWLLEHGAIAVTPIVVDTSSQEPREFRVRYHYPNCGCNK